MAHMRTKTPNAPGYDVIGRAYKNAKGVDEIIHLQRSYWDYVEWLESMTEIKFADWVIHCDNNPSEGYSLQEAEESLDAAISEFLKEGVDAEQLERIKFQMRASQIYARDDVNRLARKYGSGLTSGLTVKDIQAWPDVLQAVTEEDILAAAHEVFNLNNSVTGWLMPTEEAIQ